MKRTTCRYCQGVLQHVLPLGRIPIVNYFPKKRQRGRTKTYPLNFCVCRVCGLAQLDVIILPEKLFRAYHYATGASGPLIAHLQELADSCTKDFSLTQSSRILDIGSNDGSLLRIWQQRGMHTVGVEPSRMMAHSARAEGILTLCQFFSLATAKKMRKTYGRFDLITCTHTLANIMDLKDFLAGVKLLLSPSGHVVIEVGSLEAMLDAGQFDAIYHEHYSYFSVACLGRILEDAGFSVTQVTRNPFHGGSIRVIATHPASSVAVSGVKRQQHITDGDYAAFRQKTIAFRRKFRQVVKSLKGKVVVGFGAPAKSVTLIHYCGISSYVQAVVDATPVKQGRYVPGTHIRIYPESDLSKMHPDVIILFAWNYREEILHKISKLMTQKVLVMVPFPKIQVLSQ